MEKSDKKEEDQSSLKDNGEIDKKEQSSLEDKPENKLKNTEEKLLRAMAEIENQRRRFEKEKIEAFEFGGFNFARESLSLLDNLERAIASFTNDENLKKNKDLTKIVDGLEIVMKDLVSIFKKNGIVPIECFNKKFDPNFHQAMLEIEDNTKETGTVVQEIQKGYIMKDRLLRPSMVGVTKKRQENTENTTKKDEKESSENEVKK